MFNIATLTSDSSTIDRVNTIFIILLKTKNSDAFFANANESKSIYLIEDITSENRTINALTNFTFGISPEAGKIINRIIF